MILSQKILKKLITEVMDELEAGCYLQYTAAFDPEANQEIGGTNKPHSWERQEMLEALMEQPHTFDEKLALFKKAADQPIDKSDKEFYQSIMKSLINCRYRAQWKTSGHTAPPPPTPSKEFSAYGITAESLLKQMIVEELTKADVKDIVSSEFDRILKKELKDVVRDELIKELGSKKTKDEMGEIAKKVIKKLYKDLSYHHPYIIDRIKV